MPKSSNALAASFMISRSESDPITIETRGLSDILYFPFYSFLFLRFQGTGPNVFAVVHLFKADHAYRFIGTLNRLFESSSTRGNSQRASSRGVKNAIALACPGVKDLHIFQLGGILQPGNLFAAQEAARISAGGNHHAAGGVP